MGKFPKNYLHKVDIPEFKENENLYVTIARFTGEQEGDLSFGKGKVCERIDDRIYIFISIIVVINFNVLFSYCVSYVSGEIVIGSRELEPGWIHGRTDLGEGIFPATHAWKLDSALIKV